MPKGRAAIAGLKAPRYAESPVRGPAGSLEIAEPRGRVGQRQLARRPLLRENRLAVIEVPDLDAGVAVAQLRVDPRVILPDAPETLGNPLPVSWCAAAHLTYPTHFDLLDSLLSLRHARQTGDGGAGAEGAAAVGGGKVWAGAVKAVLAGADACPAGPACCSAS